MSNHFPEIEFHSFPFMSNPNNPEILMGLLHERPVIELLSIANLLKKDISHIKKLCTENNILIGKVNNYWTQAVNEIISVDGLVNLVHAKNANDNPVAQKLFMESFSYGLKQTLKDAASKGQSSIEFNGTLIEFEIIDGEPHLNLASLARLSGVSEEEVERDINSPEFQRYYRSLQDL